jgi:serine/threonine protein kinase
MNDFGRLFAVKQLLISLSKPETIKELQNEVEIISGLSHRNIVGYLGAKIDARLQVVNIFQEWVPGGSVAHLLKRFGAFTQHVVANYTRQILMGLSFLHSNDIIHRYVTPCPLFFSLLLLSYYDSNEEEEYTNTFSASRSFYIYTPYLKPLRHMRHCLTIYYHNCHRDIKGGNVLVDEAGTVKLADFGASTKTSALGEKSGHELHGTPYFMAPEVLSHSKYSRAGDIWSVGCTMIQMLTTQPPWKDHNLQVWHSRCHYDGSNSL